LFLAILSAPGNGSPNEARTVHAQIIIIIIIIIILTFIKHTSSILKSEAEALAVAIGEDGSRNPYLTDKVSFKDR